MPEETQRLGVPEIHCDHCKESIEGAVGALDGVSNVAVDVPEKAVTVTYDPDRLPIEAIVTAIEDQGYDVPEQEEAA